jgi:hypothetical protein
MLEVLFELTKARFVLPTFHSLVLIATARNLTSKPTSALSIFHTCLAIQIYYQHFCARLLQVSRPTCRLLTTVRLWRAAFTARRFDPLRAGCACGCAKLITLALDLARTPFLSLKSFVIVARNSIIAVMCQF